MAHPAPTDYCASCLRVATNKVSYAILFRPPSEETGMKLSARNQIKGKIAVVEKGRTTGHVQIDIGKGVIITASITNEAINELKLKKGDSAVAVIKASDVMVGKL